MECQEARILIMGYIDGELSPSEVTRLEEHLTACKECGELSASHKRLKEVTDSMELKSLPDSFWDGYWENLYRKLERGIGWVLFSVGAIILLGFALAVGLKDFFFDPGLPVWLKLGTGIGGLGLVILMVSVIRERLFAYKHERYKEVQR